MYSLIRTNPFPMARRWDGGMTDDFFRPFAELMHAANRTNLKETENAYLFDVEMPGYMNEEIDVSVSDGVLTISAEHSEETGDERQKGFSARSMQRSFSLEGIDEERITAAYMNGILRVELPKRKEAEDKTARKITVL